MMLASVIKGFEGFPLNRWDYTAFILYFAVVLGIGLWVGRRKKSGSDDYFLAGRSLPWYVVGSSFIGSNISAEHFIGMIGSAWIFGICPAMFEWGNVATFSLLIWFFIPFLLSSRVFTTPEFMEKRFNFALRQVFAIVSVITNIVAFLAAVLYGGGLALQSLFGDDIRRLLAAVCGRLGHVAPPDAYAGWDLWFAIAALAIFAASWAVHGGLKSVAWTELFTVIIMVTGGLLVTILGLYMLSGESHSLVEGFRVMIDRNRANHGIWQEVVAKNAKQMAQTDQYNRLSVIQPVTHSLVPWPGLIFVIFSVSIWYNVINQFMIQRVLAAKDMYHARMGIVLAGYLKILMPIIVVVPGLILFAKYPEIMQGRWDNVVDEIRPQADRGYVHLLRTVAPIGLRGLFLAAMFGAIQSAINSVLNSTATVFTLDVYKRMIHRTASERHLVRVGMLSSVVILAGSVILAGFIKGGSLFEYIQSLYAFFAPPFGAIFLLGILFRRINSKGATAAVILGFAFAILTKFYVALPAIVATMKPGALHDLLASIPRHPAWLGPFMIQAAIVWVVSVIVCVAVSLLTPPPAPAQVTSDLTFNWRHLNIFGYLGTRWYNSIVLWWGLFVVIITALILVFSVVL